MDENKEIELELELSRENHIKSNKLRNDFNDARKEYKKACEMRDKYKKLSLAYFNIMEQLHKKYCDLNINTTDMFGIYNIV